MVGFPNKPMAFPTKNDQHMGCEMGGMYHHLRKHPFTYIWMLSRRWMYRHRSFFTVKCWEIAWSQLLDQNWNKNTLEICKTHITQNLSGNIFVSHFLELKKGEPPIMFIIFRWTVQKSQIFWNRAENQYTSEDSGTMGLKRCKYRPLISSILVVCSMDSKTCKNQVFWRYRL